MKLSRARGPLTVIAFFMAQSAIAQESPVFVRRSALPTPPVADVAVLRQQRVEIPSASILSSPEQSVVLQLDLFTDVSFRAVRERLEPTAHGMSWVGVLDGHPESTALFVLVRDELIGHIYTPFGFFRIERQLDGTYVAQQVDQNAFPEGPDGIQSPPDSAARPSTDDRWSVRADTGSVIDVLLIYTRQVVTAFGSEARALASIDLSVAETNQALRASRIPTQIRAVHTTVVDYAETGDSSVDRVQLRDRVRDLRDRYAADISVFFLARAPGCGSSFQPSQRGAPNDADFTVHLDCSFAGGTFAQNFGRTLGASYDWYAAGSFNGRQPDYAHGFVSLPGRFRDLMAAVNLCSATRTDCPRVLVYSNPAILHNGRSVGVPAGTNVSCTRGNINNPDCDADSARAMTEMAPTVARYRHSLTALSARQLLPGASFRSASGRFQLTYQTDGNLVLYDDRDGVPLWATHTGGTSPGQAILQTDGNFVVYDGNGAAHWTSQTGGNPNAYLVVQDDGNLVIYKADGQPVWSRLQEAAGSARSR